MKKLFATLLATTMVAGTAVSAFAAVRTTFTPGDRNADYTLANVVLDDKGEPISKVSGGDKLYYPILVSQGALEKDEYNEDDFYLANKASEVEKVTARIKNVRNGKYLKDPKIVRKDVAARYTGEATPVTVTPDSTPGRAETKEQKAVYEIVVSGTATNTNSEDLTIKGVSTSDLTVSVAKDATPSEIAEAIKVKINADANHTYEASVNAATVTLTQKDAATVTAGSAPSVTIGSVEGVKFAVNEKTKGITAVTENKAFAKTAEITGVKKNYTVTLSYGTTTVTATANADGDLTTIATKFTNTSKDYDATANSDKTITFTQKKGSSDVMPTTAKVSSGNVAGDTKVYCVEVVLGDYFGNEEKELEFELELRHKGKVEYTTKDNNQNDPKTYFDLGKEGAELVANEKIGGDAKRGRVKKFRNGDLELEITADTDSVKLDKAWTLNQEKEEDVENIYLEGKDISFTFDVKASGQDDLFLSVNKDSNKKVVQANEKADIEFVNFPGKPEFDFTGLFKYTVEDPDIKYYFYEIVDDKPVKTSAKYNKEDECFELRTRTLGSYAISDKELKAAENPADKDADKPATDKPTTETPVNPTTPGKNVPTGALA